MKLQELLKEIGISLDTSIEINSIKTNSKEIVKDDLFIALNNGHDYVEEAILNGAIAVIVENGKQYDAFTIHVNSTIETLGVIASYMRKIHKIPLIAITGSNGKTTTKELISLILSKKYNVLKSEKNMNNHIGLPLTLLKLNRYYDVVVTELGMNHKGEIKYLSNICKPDYAVITNIGSAHIGNLGSKKNIYLEKLDIISNNCNLLINNDDRLLKKTKYNKLIRVNKKKLNVKNIKYFDNRIEFFINNEKFIFNSPFKHILIDVLLAIKIGLLLDVDIRLIKEAIFEYKSIDGRLSIINDKYTIINDCYNSSFEALKGALLNLKKEKRFKIIILADMLELGEYSYNYHKKVNKYLRKIKNKDVLLLGKYSKVINGKKFNNIDEIKDYLNNINIDNSIIYIKGSRKMNLDKIVDYLHCKKG